jgi:hypothetical protein
MGGVSREKAVAKSSGKKQLAKSSWQKAVGKKQLAKSSWQKAVGKKQLAKNNLTIKQFINLNYEKTNSSSQLENEPYTCKRSGIN